MAQESVFDVEGFIVNEQVTYKKLVAKLGKPGKVEGASETFTIYHYGKCQITTIEDYLSDIFFEDKTLAILTKIIPGGIRVGDNAEDVKNKILQTKEYADCKCAEWPDEFIIGSEDDWISFKTEKGKVVSISYHIE